MAVGLQITMVPALSLDTLERALADLDRRRARLARAIAALKPPPENPWAQERMLRQMQLATESKELYK